MVALVLPIYSSTLRAPNGWKFRTPRCTEGKGLIPQFFSSRSLHDSPILAYRLLRSNEVVANEYLFFIPQQNQLPFPRMSLRTLSIKNYSRLSRRPGPRNGGIIDQLDDRKFSDDLLLPKGMASSDT